MRVKVKHPDFPDYWVYSDGVITRACDSKRYQKAGDVVWGRVLESGYRQHKLTDAQGKQRLVRTNRLVCEAYWGCAISPKHQAAHKDGNKLNNSADNLYWATAKQNKADSINHGTSVKGARTRNQHGGAKLTEESVRAILTSYSGRRGDLKKLAEQFGVAPTCIQKVVSGQTWGHVPGRSYLDRMRQGQVR